MEFDAKDIWVTAVSLIDLITVHVAITVAIGGTTLDGGGVVYRPVPVFIDARRNDIRLTVDIWKVNAPWISYLHVVQRRSFGAVAGFNIPVDLVCGFRPGAVVVCENELTTRRPCIEIRRAFDPLTLVNTYGAVGSITRTRYEVVVRGTRDETVTADTEWETYEFYGKPTDPDDPPRHVRALRYRYEFTDYEAWRETGRW